MTAMLTTAQYAAARDLSVRQVERYLSAQRLPGAIKVRGSWSIPADAEPTSADVGAPSSTVVASADVGPTSALGGRFWWTVDDVVALFAPHVSEHAVREMLRTGELTGYRRGHRGAWVIPTGELRRLLG